MIDLGPVQLGDCISVSGKVHQPASVTCEWCLYVPALKIGLHMSGRIYWEGTTQEATICTT